MCRYHLGLERSVSTGKRLPAARPPLVQLYLRPPTMRLPCAAAVERATPSVSSTTTSRRRRGTQPADVVGLHGIPQGINTGDILFSLSRRLHRLTDPVPRPYPPPVMGCTTIPCVALFEGDMDIWMASTDTCRSSAYSNMIGRKTAALIAASIEPAPSSPRTTKRSSPATRGAGTSASPSAQRRPSLDLGPKQATAISHGTSRAGRDVPSLRVRALGPRTGTAWRAYASQLATVDGGVVASSANGLPGNTPRPARLQPDRALSERPRLATIDRGPGSSRGDHLGPRHQA